MSTLEELLKDAAAKGLTSLSLYPVWSADGKTTYWNASASPSTQNLPVKAAGYDPVEVLTQVLTELPKAKRRAEPKPRFDSVSPPLSELAQRAAEDQGVGTTHAEAVTAAVTPGDPVDLHDGPNDEWSRFK